MAALVGTSESGKRIRVWDSQTGSPIGDIGELSTEQSSGLLVLGPTGHTVSLDWIPDLRASLGDMLGIFENFGPRISTWSLPDGAPTGEPTKFIPGWSTVLPLGDRPEDPALVAGGSTLGIVFPNGQTPPLRLLQDATTRTGNRFDLDRLCSAGAPGGSQRAGAVPRDGRAAGRDRNRVRGAAQRTSWSGVGRRQMTDTVAIRT